MEKTPRGTSVGVDDPYGTVERCDHLTDDGRCRYAAEHGHHDPAFARERQEDDLRCPAADPDGDWSWRDCPHFRARQRSRECVRCGLEERRIAHEDERPLLEEHHLTYAEGQAPDDVDVADETDVADADGSDGADGSGDDESDVPDGAGEGTALSHEITVYLCRWCHAKIHDSWARIDDDVGPDPEAIAEAEGRRSRERAELGFESAAERFTEDEE